MKLPKQLPGIHRDGRHDAIRSAGVEPAFLGGILGKVLPIAKNFACSQCDRLPGFLKSACRAACSL